LPQALGRSAQKNVTKKVTEKVTEKDCPDGWRAGISGAR
jgi:hypothetical protein